MHATYLVQFNNIKKHSTHSVHATTSTDHNSSHLPYSIAPHAPTTFSNLNLRAMANHSWGGSSSYAKVTNEVIER